MNNTHEAEVRKHLEGGNVVPLAMALIHLSGDLSVLDEIKSYVRGAWEHLEAVPPELAASLRDRLAGEMKRIAEGGHPALANPSAETIQKMMSVAVADEVHAEYIPMLLEQMGFSVESRSTKDLISDHANSENKEDAKKTDDFHVVIIGAGASGLCAAIQLGKQGIRYTVIEKNENVGGTWYENTYPGCAVDTPNHFYQFSFEPNNQWPNYFSKQKSIQEYLEHCAKKYHVIAHTRFNSEAESAIYDPDTETWEVTARTSGDERFVLKADAIFCAVGQLNRPALPKIEGLGDFEGDVLHTASWPKQTDLKGKKVALIGTGASAVQVGPAIVDQVDSLAVLQRSGSWVMRRPNIDGVVTEDKKWVLDNVPFYASWYRFQLFWAFGDGLFEALKIDPAWQGGHESISPLNAQIREKMLRSVHKELEGREDLLQKVIPSYPPFGKRVLGDPGWFKMLRRDNVQLHTSAIKRIDPKSIVLEDGTRVEADSIIFATGFQATKMLWPMNIRGKSGVSIREKWGDSDARAYLGITVPDYPNMFILFGPNTNLGHGGSAIFLAECQVRYGLKLIQAMRQKGKKTVECRQDVHDRYNVLIDEKLAKLSWSHPSVSTWYKNADGRIVTNQPWRLVDYWRLTHDPTLDDYIVS